MIRIYKKSDGDTLSVARRHDKGLVTRNKKRKGEGGHD